MKRATLVAVTALISAVAAPVRADGPQDTAPRAEPAAPSPNLRAAARALAERGDAQFDAGRCDKAIALWKTADARFHAPTIQLRIARCQALLGKVVDAAATLLAITREPIDPAAPGVFMEAKRTAERELVDIRARIATLRLSFNNASGGTFAPTVEIDQEPFSFAEKMVIPIDPGTHLIRVRTTEVLWERRVTLNDGEVQGVKLSLSSEKRAFSLRPQQQVAYAFGGVGVASVGVGIGFAAAAFGISQRFVTVCGHDGGRCPASLRSSIDRYGLYSQVADFTLIGGGVLLATSALLLIAERRPTDEVPMLRVSASAWAPRLSASSPASPGVGLWIAGTY